MAIIDSLLVSLGYEFNDEDLDRFESSLESINKGINKVVLAAAGLVAAFSAAAGASASATDNLTKQARSIGIAADTLDAYNFAAEQTIGRNDAVSGSLRQLAIRASEAARGTGSAVEAFGILGISVTNTSGEIKSISRLLNESADALNALDNEAQRLELADKLGIAELNLLLQQGSIGITQLTREARRLGVVTKEDSRAAEEFADQMNRLQRVLTSAVRLFATSVLPVVTEIAMAFQEWIKENSAIIKSRLIQVLNGITFVLRNLKTIIVLIITLKFSFFIAQLISGFKSLAVAALGANITMLAIVGAISAVIAVVSLLIDDIVIFAKGGESAIGRLLDRFPSLRTSFEIVGLSIRVLIVAIKELYKILKEQFQRAMSAVDRIIATGQRGIERLVQEFDNAKEAVLSFFNLVEETFLKVRATINSVRELLSGDVSTIIKTIVDDSTKTIKDSNTDTGLSLSSISNLLNPASPSVSNVQSSNDNKVVNNSNTININGGDITEVKRTVTNILNDTIEQASNNAQSPARI